MKPYDLAIIGTGVKGGPISGRRGGAKLGHWRLAG